MLSVEADRDARSDSRSLSDASLEPRDQAEAAEAREDRRRRGRWVLAAISVVVASSLLATAALVERLTFYSPIAAVEERLKSEGLPTTWQEVRASAPGPPEGADSTMAWEAFLNRNARIAEFDPLAFAESERASVAWRAELSGLSDAGGYRVTAYDGRRLVDDDYMIVLDEISIEQAMHRFLISLAEHWFGRVDADGAAEAIVLSLALAANAKYEPFLVCRNIGAAMLRESGRGIEMLTRDHELSPERWIRLQRALERCDFRAHEDSMRLHEVAIQTAYVRDGAWHKEPMTEFVQTWYARRALAEQLESFDRLRRAQGLQLAERLAEFAAVDAADQEQAEQIESYLGAETRQAVIADFRFSNVLQELASVEADAVRRMLIAAIACRRFEQAERRLPRTWGELKSFDVPNPPENPWSGEPMRLRPGDDGGVAIEAPWTDEGLRRFEEVGGEKGFYDPAGPYQRITLPPAAP